MRGEFAGLVTNVAMTMERQGVTVANFVLFLSQIKAVDAVLKTAEQPCLLFNKQFVAEVQTRCSTVGEVFMFIDGYYSWFNYLLFEKIIKTFCKHDEDITERLMEYLRELEGYCKNRLCKVPQNGFNFSRRKNSKQIVFKIDEEWEEMRIETINTTTVLIAKILKLNRVLLCLRTVNNGCVELTYDTPEHVTISLTKSQQVALQEHGIRYIIPEEVAGSINQEDYSVNKLSLHVKYDGSVTSSSRPDSCFVVNSNVSSVSTQKTTIMDYAATHSLFQSVEPEESGGMSTTDNFSTLRQQGKPYLKPLARTQLEISPQNSSKDCCWEPNQVDRISVLSTDSGLPEDELSSQVLTSSVQLDSQSTAHALKRPSHLDIKTISSPGKPLPPVQLSLPDTPTKKEHLESPVIARLRKTASTNSTDSGLDSERSSRASLSPSDGIGLEPCSHASNLAETPSESKPGKAFKMSLQPQVRNVSANRLHPGCQSQTSSRSSLRTSKENTSSTLTLSMSQPVFDKVDNSPSFPSCHSEKSSRTIREEDKFSSPILTNNEVDDSKPHPPLPKTLDCPKPPLIGRRVSVEEKVPSDLLEAAMKLKSNAQPMDHLDVKDGSYPRRSSVPNEAPQPRQRTRKTSSQPFFHCLMDIPKSPARRKTSGCIVCDRNRKISQSHSPSDSTVIIKTTMSRKSLPFRRFSEPLQVCNYHCTLLCNCY